MYLLKKPNTMDSTTEAIFILIKLIFGLLFKILVNAFIVSGIFHICSKVTKRDRFAFWKVFPYVFVVMIIFEAIFWLLHFLVAYLAAVTA